MPFEQQDVLDQLEVLHEWMTEGYTNSDAATASEASGMWPSLFSSMGGSPVPSLMALTAGVASARECAYLEEKIGVHLNVQCISWGGWGDQRSVILSTNEPYDILFTDSGSYTSDVARQVGRLAAAHLIPGDRGDLAIITAALVGVVAGRVCRSDRTHQGDPRHHRPDSRELH